MEFKTEYYTACSPGVTPVSSFLLRLPPLDQRQHRPVKLPGGITHDGRSHIRRVLAGAVHQLHVAGEQPVSIQLLRGLEDVVLKLKPNRGIQPDHIGQ